MKLDIESAGQSFQPAETDGISAAFDIAEMRQPDSEVLRQQCLRHAALHSKLSHAPAEANPEFFHGNILVGTIRGNHIPQDFGDG